MKRSRFTRERDPSSGFVTFFQCTNHGRSRRLRGTTRSATRAAAPSAPAAARACIPGATVPQARSRGAYFAQPFKFNVGPWPCSRACVVASDRHRLSSNTVGNREIAQPAARTRSEIREVLKHGGCECLRERTSSFYTNEPSQRFRGTRRACRPVA